jgi:hypothetical protein
MLNVILPSFSQSSSYLLGVKRPERESDYLNPSGTEIKHLWIFTFIPSYIFVEWRLKRDNFAFHRPSNKVDMITIFELSINKYF